MDNLALYNQVRAVPDSAQKEIKGGRLKGKTDINPIWRIKTLTEQFGPCGIGWSYEITRQWSEPGANGEISVFCNIILRVKMDETWSEPIPGTGGSALVAQESNGLYTSDECYKMALTDAISVACKALGFGADIYWDRDKSKYDALAPLITREQTAGLAAELQRTGGNIEGVLQTINKWFHTELIRVEQINEIQFNRTMRALKGRPDKA